MLIVMEAHATAEQVERVCDEIRAMGYLPHAMPGPTRTAIGITGNEGEIVQTARIQSLPGVFETVRITKPYKLVSRDFRESDTIVELAGLQIGGNSVVVMAGPCTIESREQLIETWARQGESFKARKGCAIWPRYAMNGARRWLPR